MAKGIPNRARPLAIVLCGAGAWLCGELLSRQADLWGSAANAGLIGRACAAASSWGFDCSGEKLAATTVPVPLPTWTSTEGLGLRRGDVPLSFLGLAYFVAMGCWLVFVGLPRRSGPRWASLPAWMASAAALVSLGLLAAMLVGRAPRCLIGALVQVLNLALAAALWRSSRPRADAFAASAPNVVPAYRLAVQAVVFAAILVAGLGIFRREHLALGSHVQALRPYRQIVETLRGDAGFLIREYFAQDQHPELAPGGDVPELVIFTDFACPACVCTAGRVQEMIAPAFGGRLRVQYRHFPLDSGCNPRVTGQPHPTACLAASVLEAARAQVGEANADALRGPLYALAPKLDEAAAIRWAERIGLDAARFARDLRDPAIAEHIREDVEVAHTVGVTATPAVFFNGRLVGELAADNPVFWNAIAAELAASPAESLASAECVQP